MARRLIELGADVNIEIPDRSETALHHAAHMGRTEAVKLLLAARANPNT